jgi:hypothetical protein
MEGFNVKIENHPLWHFRRRILAELRAGFPSTEERARIMSQKNLPSGYGIQRFSWVLCLFSIFTSMPGHF